jgi:hypothetical protein
MDHQWIGQSTNVKTGNVPTLWVGGTREESKNSCGKCPLLKRNSVDGKAQCYSQHGTPSFAHASIIKAATQDPKRYTFDRAIEDRRASARMARFASIGDPAALVKAELKRQIKAVRALKLRVVGYTSQYDKPDNAWLAKHFMASAKSIDEADQLVARGWRATVVVEPEFTPGRSPAGNYIMLCPAIAAARHGKEITCNNTGKGEACKFCDASEEGPIVAFPDHGPSARAKLQRTTINARTKRAAIRQFNAMATDRIAIGVKRKGAAWSVTSVAA